MQKVKVDLDLFLSCNDLIYDLIYSRLFVQFEPFVITTGNMDWSTYVGCKSTAQRGS